MNELSLQRGLGQFMSAALMRGKGKEHERKAFVAFLEERVLDYRRNVMGEEAVRKRKVVSNFFHNLVDFS